MIGEKLHRIVNVASALMFSVIFVLAAIKSGLLILLFAALFLAGFCLFCRAIRKVSEKKLMAAFYLCLAMFTAGLICCGMLLRVHPAWDFGRIFYGAQDLLQHGSLLVTQQYYLESLNNLFPTL